MRGGTGKGLGKEQKNGEYYALTWEIKDNILNINNTVLPNGMGIQSFKIESGIMTSVDEELVYYQEK